MQHLSKEAALATQAKHFAKVGGMIHSFTDEDACWRFIHNQRDCFRSDPTKFLNATYLSRRELAA